MARILISGGSGLIGRALLQSLRASGYQVSQLVRQHPASADELPWDPERPLPPETVSSFDAVIHLAGESVAGRWTSAKKQRIEQSRVVGTAHLAQALAHAAQRPRVLISASATGYYGNRGDEILTEDSLPGEGFLPEVCKKWEAAAQPAGDAGIRTVRIRTGMVLSANGGALKKMLPAFRMGVGGKIGNGCQWMSWISLEDLTGAIQHILATDSIAGAVNLTSPNPVTNAGFTRVLASVLHRPAIFPLPALAVRLMFGEMGEELLLAGARVEPAKLLAGGYSFRHSDLRKTLEEILRT